jgi:D-ribose pyranase
MLKTGILNPHLNSLLSRVRHTNLLVIADRGFPYWPMIETIDIALVDDLPTVLQVLDAIRPNFVIGQVMMAHEFCANNALAIQERFAGATAELHRTFLLHVELKQLVPGAIGLIRTGDTVAYANMILESA